MTYISKAKVDRIRKIITELQKAYPFKAVTKKQVQDRIKADYAQPEIEYRVITRAFEKLIKNKSIVKDGRGQYWLPDYHANCIRNLKRIGDFDSLKEVGAHFLDVLRYCESDEDWKLLGEFFAKMNENKRERDRAEFEEADQRLKDEVSAEME